MSNNIPIPQNMTPSTVDFEQLEVVSVWVTVLGDVLGAIATTGLYIQAQNEKEAANNRASMANKGAKSNKKK